MLINHLKKFILSNYGPVLIGILFTGLIGWGFNYLIQSQIMTREENFEIYRNNTASAQNILEQIVNLINSRMFTLQRVVWTYKNAEIEDAKQDWNDYRKQLEKWNLNDTTYKKRLDIYFGKNMADRFIGNSNSVYNYFWIAHRHVLDWKSCLRKACLYSKTEKEVCETEKCNKEKKLSDKSLKDLRKKANAYINDIYLKFKAKYLRNKTMLG